MKHLPAACLLLLLCLLSQPATSQVYRLSAGDVVRAPLVGIDTATYRSTHAYVATASQLLLVRANRIAQLERSGRLADSVQTAYAAELRRCQAGRAASDADYEKMRTAARVALASPPRPPLLLDSRTYKGMGAGAAIGLLLKVLVFR